MASSSRAINTSSSRLTRPRTYHPISTTDDSTRRASGSILDAGRRTSGSILTSSQTMPNVAAPKISRTSKTSQRHVVLPSEPQTRPLPEEIPEGAIPAYDIRSEGERMSKKDRQTAGYSRMTAYSVAEGIRMKHLSAFLKREHAVLPRVFDEAIYVVRECVLICVAVFLIKKFIRFTIFHCCLATFRMSMCALLYPHMESPFSLECRKQRNMGMKGLTSLRWKMVLESLRMGTYPHLLI